MGDTGFGGGWGLIVKLISKALRKEVAVRG